jgi:hypothetical protein
MNDLEARKWLTYARSDLDAGWALLRDIWAIESRYPSDLPEVTESDANGALQMAERVYQVTAEDLSAPP